MTCSNGQLFCLSLFSNNNIDFSKIKQSISVYWICKGKTSYLLRATSISLLMMLFSPGIVHKFTVWLYSLLTGKTKLVIHLNCIFYKDLINQSMLFALKHLVLYNAVVSLNWRQLSNQCQKWKRASRLWNSLKNSGKI